MANLEIRKHKWETEIIDVKLPYYYIHHLDTQTIYGMINSKKTTTICEVDDGQKYEIEQEDFDGDGSYFTDIHKSDADTYNKAKQRLINFINCL